MLTSPNVIVPDHKRANRRAGAFRSAAALRSAVCLRLGNFLLLHGSDAGPQAVGETLAAASSSPAGSTFSPRALASINLHSRFAIFVLPLRRIEVGFDGRDELRRQLQLARVRSCRLRGLDAGETQHLVGATQCRNHQVAVERIQRPT